MTDLISCIPGIAQIAEATISIKRLQNFMLYEDTSKPVPGLAEIQTAVKKKSKETKEDIEGRESVPSNKGEVEVKDEKKPEINEKEKADEAKGNG